MNRAAEFAALASAAIDPRYRALWQSQAEWYGGQAANVGNSEPAPAPKFRAANESTWARLFDALGVAWEYGARFRLVARATWLEAKEAAPTEREIRAARELLAADGNRVYIVNGWPRRKGYGVWVLAREGEFMAVRSDFRDLALANLLGVSFGKLYQVFDEAKNGRTG